MIWNKCEANKKGGIKMILTMNNLEKCFENAKKENASGARHHSRKSSSCRGCKEGGAEVGEWTKKNVREIITIIRRI